MKNYNMMTNEELETMVEGLRNILKWEWKTDKEWIETYEKYKAISGVLRERYREEDKKDFDAFYEKNIKGKDASNIDGEVWEYYSDWHKDIYGYRPKEI